MKQTCKICGASAESEYCFQHKPRKALKQSKWNKTTLDVLKKDNYISDEHWNQGYRIGYDSYDETTKGSSASVKSFGEALDMMKLFTGIWRKRPHKSEISGEKLGKEALSVYFHHILPKEKYPEACLDEENIILLTLIEHDNVERDIFRYEEINKRREILKTKYNIL